jgi:hypothetical protein
MADAAKPEKTKTQDLADRVVDAVDHDQDVSPFHNEINGLTNDERMQFTKDLSRSALTNTVDSFSKPDDQKKFLYADGKVDTNTGEMLDVDLVVKNYKDGEAHHKRIDLFTPGEAGEKYDKQQEIDAKLSPYARVFNLLNAQSRDYISSDSERDANFGTARALLEKHTEGDPDRAALLDSFQKSIMGSDPENIKPIDGIDSAMAMGADDRDTPKEVRDLINILQKSAVARRTFEDGPYRRGMGTYDQVPGYGDRRGRYELEPRYRFERKAED